MKWTWLKWHWCIFIGRLCHYCWTFMFYCACYAYSSPFLFFLLYSSVLHTTNLHAHMGEKRKDAYRGLVGKHERNRHFGKSRCRWESNIKINHKWVGMVSTSLSGCGWGPVLHSCKLRNKPLVSIKEWEFLAFWRSISLSSRTVPCGVSLGSTAWRNTKFLPSFVFLIYVIH